MRNQRAHISLFDLLNRLIWMFKFRLRATQFARGLRVWLIPFLRPAGHLASLLRDSPPSASPASSPPRVSQHPKPPRSRTVNFLRISSIGHTETPDTPLSVSPLELSHGSPLNWRVLFALCYVWSFTHGDFPIARLAKRKKKKGSECKWRFGSRSPLNIIRGSETEKIIPRNRRGNNETAIRRKFAIIELILHRTAIKFLTACSFQ